MDDKIINIAANALAHLVAIASLAKIDTLNINNHGILSHVTQRVLICPEYVYKYYISFGLYNIVKGRFLSVKNTNNSYPVQAMTTPRTTS